MPCVELRIDNSYNRIDSPDYEMVGAWLGDMLRLGRVNPATLLNLKVWPYMMPSDPYSWTEPWVPDWCADSRHMRTYAVGGAQSAADAARMLADQLTQFAQTLDKEADPS